MSTLSPAISSQQEGDQGPLSMLLSPVEYETERRMRLGSDPGLDFSDTDLHFPCSQPLFPSSQMNSLLGGSFSAGGASSSGNDAQSSGGSGIILPPLVGSQGLSSSGVVLERLSVMPCNPSSACSGMPSNASSIGSSDTSRRRTKHCIFLFQDWPDEKQQIIVEVKKVVTQLLTLKKNSYNLGITLTEPPTFFPNKEGRGTYLVLTSSSTFVHKWKQVAENICCYHFRPVFREHGIKSGQHGFDSIAKSFNMTTGERNNLHLNRVICDQLPEKGKKRKKTLRCLPSVADDDEEEAPLHAPGKSSRSVGKKRGRTQGARDSSEELGEDEDEPTAGPAAKMPCLSLHGKKHPRYQLIRSRPDASAASSPSSSGRPRGPSSMETLAAIALSSSPVQHQDSAEGGAGSDEEQDLHQSCLNFIRSPNPIQDSYKLLQKIRQITSVSGNGVGLGAKYLGFFIDQEMFKAFRQFVVLQTQVLEIIQNDPISIPVESLSAHGIVKQDKAWRALQGRNPVLHSTVMESLDFLVAEVDGFFRALAHPLLDMSSTAFFLASHILGKNRLDKTPLLFLTLKGINQDLRYLFSIIKSMSDFIRLYTRVELLHIDVQSMLIPSSSNPEEAQFIEWVPVCLREIPQSENANFNMKSQRVARFDQTVKNMNKAYKLADKSDAENLFKMMQQSVPVFCAMTTKHEMYSLLCSATSDPAALAELFKKIRTSTALA